MRRAGRRPRWRRDATSGFWSAYHLVHSSGSAWRRRWTAWGQGVRPHADSGSKGVVRSVSVGRLERPHAHHELALRSVWFVNGAIHLALFLVGRRLLTTERMDAARAAAPGATEAPSSGAAADSQADSPGVPAG